MNETRQRTLPTRLFTRRGRYDQAEPPHEVLELVFREVSSELHNVAVMRKITVHYRGAKSSGGSACRGRDRHVGIPRNLIQRIASGCARSGWVAKLIGSGIV